MIVHLWSYPKNIKKKKRIEPQTTAACLPRGFVWLTSAEAIRIVGRAYIFNRLPCHVIRHVMILTVFSAEIMILFVSVTPPSRLLLLWRD